MDPLTTWKPTRAFSESIGNLSWCPGINRHKGNCPSGQQYVPQFSYLWDLFPAYLPSQNSRWHLGAPDGSPNNLIKSRLVSFSQDRCLISAQPQLWVHSFAIKGLCCLSAADNSVHKNKLVMYVVLAEKTFSCFVLWISKPAIQKYFMCRGTIFPLVLPRSVHCRAILMHTFQLWKFIYMVQKIANFLCYQRQFPFFFSSLCNNLTPYLFSNLILKSVVCCSHNSLSNNAVIVRFIASLFMYF